MFYSPYFALQIIKASISIPYNIMTENSKKEDIIIELGS